MDLQQLLQVLGEFNHAVYVPYGVCDNPDRLARALGSHLPQPAKIFSVACDALTPEDGETLVEAITSNPTVVIAGSSESELIRRLGYYWPDYCEHPQHWHGAISHHVDLKARESSDALASIYLLIPVLTSDHFSDRPGVFRYLSDPRAAHLLSPAPDVQLSVRQLGRFAAQIDASEITMKGLCLLHERDSMLGTRQPHRELSEFINSSDPLSWADLQTLLHAQPDYGLLSHVRERLTSEQYAYGCAAAKYLITAEGGPTGGVYPDIYSAVWSMERVFSDGTIFRGQVQSEWGLESTLMRPNGAGVVDAAEFLQRMDVTLEFISSMKQRANELFGKELDDDSLLAVAQHFGFPTPLLDFTESLRIAAFFATQSAAELPAADPPIGVIFYIMRPDQADDRSPEVESSKLLGWAGVRTGKLHVIRPDLPDGDDRIRRQQGVFIAGYHARDLQAVTIDRIYFKQHRGVTFQDPRGGISPELLLPLQTELSKLAEGVKQRARSLRFLGRILAYTPLGDSGLIGTAGVHLYWHLRFGQEFLNQLKVKANASGVESLYPALEGTLTQYFRHAKAEADISSLPSRDDPASRIDPIYTAIAALEKVAGLAQHEIWHVVRDQLPKDSEFGGHVPFKLPSTWSESARIAFTCALFCVAWEHLRIVRGSTAQEFVQAATLYLHGIDR